MQLYVDPCIAPVGYDNWESNVSVAQAHIYRGLGRAGVERHFLRSWKWAREATKAANAIAASTSDELGRAEALRIAKRHDGVWRAANKLTSRNNANQEVRTCVAVRSDSGDSTCPTWLEREGKRRIKAMHPILRGCTELGYVLASAHIYNVNHTVASNIRRLFANESFRNKNNIAGIDVLFIPVSPTGVDVWLIAAFIGYVHPIDVGGGFNFPNCIAEFVTNPEVEGIYMKMYEAAENLGPAKWIEAQLSRFIDGKRARDRATYGVFYGKASEEIVMRGASIEIGALTNVEAGELAIIRHKIHSAMELTLKAAKVGDVVASKAAHGFAVAYAQDAQTMFERYPAIYASLALLTSFDFTGFTDSPPLHAIHEELMVAVRAMPAPKGREVSAWTCVEHVAVHGPKDIAALAEWMRAID